MRINGFRCDECNKEHLLEPHFVLQFLSAEVLPEGWYIVSQGGHERRSDPLLFCSKECLRRHPLTNNALRHLEISREKSLEGLRGKWEDD